MQSVLVLFQQSSVVELVHSHCGNLGKYKKNINKTIIQLVFSGNHYQFEAFPSLENETYMFISSENEIHIGKYAHTNPVNTVIYILC